MGPADVVASRITKLTPGDYWYGDPQWSPDGRRLYVGSQRAMSSERGIVYEINGPFPW